MAFAVGTNSYASVADADTYHADRGNAAWASADTNVKQSALIKATDFIDQEYGQRFIGTQTETDQPLEWPRTGIDWIADSVIPSALRDAVCILALESLSDDLNPNLERGGAVKREKVDVLETEYFDNAPARTVRPAIDGILRKIITSGLSINAKVVRV